LGRNHKKLFNNLETLRKSSGLTQQDLSEKAGVSRKSINAIENGVYIPPPEGVCCSTCVLYGDLNFDGIINVIDVVTMVNGIISGEFDSNVLLVADINGDGTVNVIDIVSLVNLIIS